MLIGCALGGNCPLRMTELRFLRNVGLTQQLKNLISCTFSKVFPTRMFEKVPRLSHLSLPGSFLKRPQVNLSLARSAIKAINANLQPKQSEMVALTEQIGELLLNGEDISPAVLSAIKKFGEESKDAKGTSMKKSDDVIDVTDYEIVTDDED